jgi:hypothetical protein
MTSPADNLSLEEAKDCADVQAATVAAVQAELEEDNASSKAAEEAAEVAAGAVEIMLETKSESTTDEPSPQSKSSPRISNGAGLSELSKQLRVLQAKNESQAVEISRLERQLRILADLQDVSVSDLQRALQAACESEAHGELLNQVAKLKAQLDAVSVAKQGSAVSNSHQIANLQLRIGELEEIEEKQRKEIGDLYNQLRERAEKAKRLEAFYEQLRVENEHLKQKQKQGSDRLATSKVNDDIQVQQGLVAAEAARLAEVEVKALQEKLALSEQQRKAAEEQAKLREAQSKARAFVQEERIKDLEGQLASLYTAFELLQQEREEEEATHATLKSNLDQADASVARQVRDLEHSESSRSMSLHAAAVPIASASAIPPESPSSLLSSTPKKVVSPVPSPRELGEPVIAGTLFVRTNSGLRRKWKQQRVVLYSTLSNYYLDFGEGKGTELYFCMSKVQPYHNKQQRHAFQILINPNNVSSEALYLAGSNEEEYHDWMAALTLATTGESYVRPEHWNHEYTSSTDFRDISSVALD